jgi:hypothetical protein
MKISLRQWLFVKRLIVKDVLGMVAARRKFATWWLIVLVWLWQIKVVKNQQQTCESTSAHRNGITLGSASIVVVMMWLIVVINDKSSRVTGVTPIWIWNRTSPSLLPTVKPTKPTHGNWWKMPLLRHLELLEPVVVMIGWQLRWLIVVSTVANKMCQSLPCY